MKHISRIFIPHKLSAKKTISLDKKTSHHLLTVLRLQLGSAVIIFDGEGGEYRGELIGIDKKQAKIQIGDFCDVNRESLTKIELLQGLARNERMDIVMQKAVELGVNTITPVWTEFSNVKMDKAKIEKRLMHWKKIMINATEQSGRCIVAKLNPPIKLSEWLNKKTVFDLKLVCHHFRHCEESTQLTTRQSKTVCILIGPEGGLSETEVNTAQSNGFEIFSLGPRILRTETAAIAALSIIQSQLSGA